MRELSFFLGTCIVVYSSLLSFLQYINTHTSYIYAFPRRPAGIIRRPVSGAHGRGDGIGSEKRRRPGFSISHQCHLPLPGERRKPKELIWVSHNNGSCSPTTSTYTSINTSFLLLLLLPTQNMSSILTKIVSLTFSDISGYIAINRSFSALFVSLCSVVLCFLCPH